MVPSSESVETSDSIVTPQSYVSPFTKLCTCIRSIRGFWCQCNPDSRSSFTKKNELYVKYDDDDDVLLKQFSMDFQLLH